MSTAATTDVRCPDCGTALTGEPTCTFCGPPVVGPTAARLWQVDQRLAFIVGERTLLAGAGALLVVLGATYEQRLRDMRRPRERYEGLE
ncbi:MAG: hypothetical protein JWM02_2092 [Frankiales bacterium]|nr:hypothetical protein [Frankiales bacterium]